MRQIVFTGISMLLLTGYASAQSSKKQTLEGNGNVITREVSVSPFTTLKANGVYELKLIQGSKESVKIEADENLHELVTVSNEGSSLVIHTKKMEKVNLTGKYKLKVYVTFTKLKDVDLGMVGNVSSEDELTFDKLHLDNKSVGNVELKFTADRLDLNNSSVGNVRLRGKVQEAVVKNTGVGNLEAGGLEVQTMSIDNSGVGNAVVNAQKNLKVTDSFLGKVRNKGAAPIRKKNKVRV